MNLAQFMCGGWFASVIPVQARIQNFPRESGDLVLRRHLAESLSR
jgi:hypothetical protein